MTIEPREKLEEGITRASNSREAAACLSHIGFEFVQSHKACRRVSFLPKHLSQEGVGTQYLLYSTLFVARDPLHALQIKVSKRRGPGTDQIERHCFAIAIASGLSALVL